MMNAVWGGRTVNPSLRSIATVGVIAATGTAFWFGLPPIHFGYPFPGLAQFVGTILAAAALVLAVLFYMRHRRTRQVSDLVICSAFALTALLESVLPLVASIEPSAATVMLWGRTLGRLVVGVALCTAAWMPDRRLRRGVSPPTAMTIAAVLGLTVVGYVMVRHGAFPEAIQGSFDTASRTTVLTSAGGRAIRTIGALLLAAAAIGFTRRRIVDPTDQLAGWLAIAAILFSTARVHDALWPSRFADWLTTADLLRATAEIVLVVGAVHEVIHLWRGKLAEATNDERRRVARELHDGVAQELAYLTTNAMIVAEGSDADHPLRDLAVSAERALHETRAAITALSDDDALRLDQVVETVGEDLAARHGCPVALDLSTVVVDEHTGHELARVAHEAVSNAARHGRPDHISVHLRESRRGVTLRVVDDGTGIPGAATAAGFGLISMRERVEGLGGTCSIRSAPGRGTEVLVEVPRS